MAMLTDAQVLQLITDIETAAFELGLQLEALGDNSTLNPNIHFSALLSLAKALDREKEKIQEGSTLLRMCRKVKPQLRVVT